MIKLRCVVEHITYQNEKKRLVGDESQGQGI